MKRRVELRINDENYEVEVEPHWTLLEVLRDRLGLMGTKEGCGLGACGACTVIVEDAPVLSCLTLAVDVEGKSITTIEGLSKGGGITSPADRLCESWRNPVWFLHSRSDPVLKGTFR